MKTKKPKNKKYSCNICRFKSADESIIRHGVTGKTQHAADGKYVSICPRCGSVREVEVKDGIHSEPRPMSLLEILEQKEAMRIMMLSTQIAHRFIDRHPNHPMVKQALASFDEMKKEALQFTGDNDERKLKASLDYRQPK